ncbi:MAG: DUF2142 domain-containing protein [Lachnospiraceae bacterium]|nr:DUF2142 domain-containing protein [Lachnospiraceae bacterium]
MLERIKGKAVLCLILTIFWVGLILIHNPHVTNKYAIRYFGISHAGGIPVNGGETVEQDFTISGGGLMRLKCFVGGVDAEGEQLRFRVKTGDGKIVGEQVLAEDSYEIWHIVDIEMNTDLSGVSDYTLEITNISPPSGPGFVVYGYFPNQKGLTSRQPAAKRNGADSGMSVVMRAGIWDGTIQKIYYGQWLIMIALSYLVVLFLNDSPSRNFLVISTVIGLLFAVYNPFWNYLDENTHYFRSYAISEGYWHDGKDENGAYGGNLPANFDDSLIVTLSPINYYANADILSAPYSSEKEWYTTPYMSSVLPFDHMIAAIGIKIGTLLRLPIVCVVLLARLTDLVFYIALSYVAIRRMHYYKIVFFTMATIPLATYLAGACSQDAVHISSTFLFLAILLSYVFEDPGANVNAVTTDTGYIDVNAVCAAAGENGALRAEENAFANVNHGVNAAADTNSGTDDIEIQTSQSTDMTESNESGLNAENSDSVSADTSSSLSGQNQTHSHDQLSAAQLGGFAKVEQVSKIGIPQIVGLLILFVFVASIKYLIYSLLFVLVFFIPKERFAKPGMKKWFILSGVLLGVLLMVYQVYMLKTYPFVEMRNGDVDVAGQMAFVFGDFYGAFRILAHYFTGQFLLQLYGIYMFGEFNGIAYLLSGVILLSGVLAADKYHWENPRRRAAFHWVSFITIVVMCALIISALYVGYTPVGSTDVDGVQTRYLIPFLPLLGIVIADLPVESKIRHLEEKIAFIMVLGNMLFLAYYTLIDRLFYWPSVWN